MKVAYLIHYTIVSEIVDNKGPARKGYFLACGWFWQKKRINESIFNTLQEMEKEMFLSYTEKKFVMKNINIMKL